MKLIHYKQCLLLFLFVAALGWSSCSKKMAVTDVGSCKNKAAKKCIQTFYKTDIEEMERAMGRLLNLNKKAVPCLCKALEDKNNPMVRSQSAATLAGIGSKATAAVPVLAKLLTDEDDNVRWNAVSAIGAIGKADKSIVKQLEKLQASEQNSYVQEEMMKTIKILSSL